MFGGILVEDGIGVVDVNEDLARGGIGRELREKAVASGERDVTHFAGGFVASTGREEFVVGPEGAVEQDHAAGSGGFEPFAGDIGKARCEEERFGALFEAESNDGLLRNQRATELGADVVGKASAYGDWRADESRRSGGIFAEAAGQAATWGEQLPLDGRFGAVEDVEDTIFVLHDFLNGGSGKNEEGLEFAEME